MSDAYYLAETVVNLIQATIKANIAQSLANVRNQRVDAIVTTEPPREYFIYEAAHVYRAPAVFTIIKDQNIRDSQMKPNHINSMCDVTVAVVVEDRLERLVTIKAWRYQAALMPILHQVSLTNSNGDVRLFSRVQNCQFSGVVDIKDEKAVSAVFRKEMSLRLQVEHIEQLQAVPTSE